MQIMRDSVKNVLYKPVVSSPKYVALCFVFPVVILGTVFALHKVYPFGNRMILVQDFRVQYYPFLSNLWHKLREGLSGSPSLPGGVSPWSWTAGGGHDYAALIAYYMASPLNLFALILPHAWLREALTLILLVRIGCAGLFMGVFLRSTFKQCGPALPFFSSLYALCAFTLGYYWNIMWFDSFALLPLVALGVLGLVKDGKYRLYIASLAVSVFTNFYMGIFVCIFAALAFFGLCFIRKLKARDFLHRLGLIAGCSALAIGMAAVVIIPSLSALKNIYNVPGIAFPTKPALYTSFFSILGNFIAFTPPTNMKGLPNLYCGMISVLLAGLYIYSPKISRREKLVSAGTVVFLLISCNLNALDYIMHGFRYPNQLPSRFSFLISFILVVMAYRAFLLTEGALAEARNRRRLLAMGISAAVFLLAAVFGSQGKNSIIGSAVLCVFYLLIFYFFTGTRTRQTTLRIVFLAAVLTELSITSYIGVKTVGTYDRDTYPDRYRQIQALLDMRRPPGDPRASPLSELSGEPAGIDFYRTDIIGVHSANNSSLYNYNGISFFSSTANADVSRFMVGLGLPCFIRSSHYWYTETSPLTGAFLNMRYTIGLLGNAGDNSVYWATVGNAGNIELLENKRYLPLCFMTHEDITDYVHHSNPFLSQNDLFRSATKLNEDLFAIVDISALGRKDERGNTEWGFEILSDDMIYAYCEVDTNGMIGIFNGDNIHVIPTIAAAPYIFTVGNFSRGDTVSLLLTAGNASVYLGYLNSEVFELGYALLADETLNLTKFTDTCVSGNVTALKDGILYTSIPVDKNWNVFVDGVKSEIVLIDNAMAAVRLTEGAHTVKFRYFNKSLLAGIIVSLVSLAAFAALIFRNTLKRRKP